MSDDRALEELEMIEVHPALETRSAEVVEVRHPDRIVTLVAVPYDIETPIFRRGQWVIETVRRGAFDGVEHRARRVKVNRDHDVGRTCGRAVALYPDDRRGLLAELRISPTPLGEETLTLAADGVLDASVGFAPMRGGEAWTENRSRREISRAWLGHIALVPDPAYEGAEVLDVRSATLAALTMIGNSAQDLGHLSTIGAPVPEAAPAAGSATPRKDEVLARLAQLGYPLRSQ